MSTSNSAGSPAPARYAFLSDEWITETRKLREEYRDRNSPPPVAVRMNLVVSDVPFGGGSVNAHLDTSQGEPELDLGHLENAEITVKADYTTTKSVLVEGNMGAAMEGMALGRIQVQGDMMKLMSLTSLRADPASIELAKRIRDITE